MTMDELFDLIKNQRDKMKSACGTRRDYARGTYDTYGDVLYRIDPQRWEAEVSLMATGGIK